MSRARQRKVVTAQPHRIAKVAKSVHAPKRVPAVDAEHERACMSSNRPPIAKTAQTFDEPPQERDQLLQDHEQILSMVSHDLRNPLGIIVLAANELAASTAAPGETDTGTQRAVAAILRAAGNMNRLVADLLDQSRMRSGRLRVQCEDVAVSQLLSELSELGQLARDKRVTLSIEPPQPDRAIHCDRMRMNQALGNLISNALEFAPTHSTISVFTEQAEGGIWFVVRDQGPGIASDDLPKIFDPYWQSRKGRRSGGLGLGLYIVNQIVKAHSGRISVESCLGAGSSFKVFMPCAETPRPRAWPANPSPSPQEPRAIQPATRTDELH